MSSITIDCPDTLPAALGKREAELGPELLLMAALHWYETGRLSSGLAADVAGLSRVAFLSLCGAYGISIFQQSPQELADDVNAAEKCASL